LLAEACVPNRAKTQSGKLDVMTTHTVVLLRHAKAETPGDGPDFTRTLADRGRSDADAAGAWLADEGLWPDLVLCSPANRTRETWHLVAIAMATAKPDGPAPEVRYEQGLYDGGRTEVFDLLRGLNEDVRTVLVVGHNPTMSDVSLLLRPDPANGNREGLKTTGLAVHRADHPWDRTEPGSMPQIAEHTARG
jgi:phosphohistidine phosphatase